MQKNVNYEELETAKAFVSTGGIMFGTPKDYADKFMSKIKVEPKDCRFELQGDVTNANPDGTLNISYDKILVETSLDFKNTIQQKNIGMVLNLSTQKPLIRVYTGSKVFACSNQCISGADSIFSAEIITNLDSAYNMVEEYKKNAEKEWLEQLELWKIMQETVWSGSQVQSKLGFMLEQSIKNGKFKAFGTSAITSAAKLLYGKSDYQIKGAETTAWNVYNSITAAIGEQHDFISAPVKSALASQLIILS